MSVKTQEKVDARAAALHGEKRKVKKARKEISQAQAAMDSAQAALDAATVEHNRKELDGLEGPDYFQTRYQQLSRDYSRYDGMMNLHKVIYKGWKEKRDKTVKAMIHLDQEIEEEKTPIIKLARSLEKDAWKQGEVDLLTNYGLAESVTEKLKAAGFTTVGSLSDSDAWEDADGIGDATAEKVHAAVEDMLRTYDEKLEELKKMQAENS